MSETSQDVREFDVLATHQLVPGSVIPVTVGLWQILLVRTPDGIFALNNRCSHAAVRLATGRVRGQTIMCPRHGARFDVATGRCITAEYSPIRTFGVSVVEDRVIVSVPRQLPAMNEIPVA